MELPRPSAPKPTENSPSKRRVVVADDNVYLARTLKMVLELWGFEATVVHDGAAALTTLLAGGTAAALLDLRLPRMGGLQVARELQSRPDVRPAQLIAMTGSLSSEDRTSSLAAGFDHHLIKPVDPNLLRSLLGDP
jgi:two-component system CheB/CheR fusion protein